MIEDDIPLAKLQSEEGQKLARRMKQDIGVVCGKSKAFNIPYPNVC